MLIVEAIEDLGQLLGVGDGAAGVVHPGYHQAARRQQTVVLHAAHPFDTVAICGAVEGLHQRVEHGDRVLTGHLPREVVETQQLRVDHRHIPMLGADVLLTVAEAPRNRFGHEALEQFVVLVALSIDELLLGLQARTHVVEGGRQLPELVGGGDRNRGTEVAATDPTDGLDELLDRPGQDPGEQQGEQTHRQHHRCGGECDVAGESAYRRQCL